MKAQIDHLPLAYKGLRPTQGRPFAVMQVCAGSPFSCDRMRINWSIDIPNALNATSLSKHLWTKLELLLSEVFGQVGSHNQSRP